MTLEIGSTMMAVVTTGNGGYDKLDYRAVPVPVPGPGEVLVNVLAAGVNNTEINTRLGWYSSSVTDSTDDTAGVQAEAGEQKADGGWNKATPFPLIQGTWFDIDVGPFFIDDDEPFNVLPHDHIPKPIAFDLFLCAFGHAVEIQSQQKQSYDPVYPIRVELRP